VAARPSLSTSLSQVLIAFTIELDNEFERRFAEAGGGARPASYVVWANFLRVVGEGVAVSDLPAATGLQKRRLLAMLGGMERWRYVFVGPAQATQPPDEKRDGYGSSRGLRADWVVRPTSAGRRAAAIWRTLPDDIEHRWRERLGPSEVEELTGLLQVIGGGLRRALPAFLPLLGSANGMAADVPELERREEVEETSLVTLLAHALLGYTLEFEKEAPLSLPVSANVVRVLDESSLPLDELPARSGISKEAASMVLTVLAKTEYAVVAGKEIRLTRRGRAVRDDQRRLHARIERTWEARLDRVVPRLQAALDGILDHPQLTEGLRPPPGGWRASRPYLERTQAVLADPRGALPHYPMVLHRGGWPDGS
jgi:hypothetical protein